MMVAFNRSLTALLGRTVLQTSLDPLPPMFRSAPGVIAVNDREVAAIAANDGDTFKRLIAVCQHQDNLDLERREHRIRTPARHHG